MDLLGLRLIGAVGARINVRSLYSQFTRYDWDSRPGSSDCKHSVLITNLSHYLQVLNKSQVIGMYLCMYIVLCQGLTDKKCLAPVCVVRKNNQSE